MCNIEFLKAPIELKEISFDTVIGDSDFAKHCNDLSNGFSITLKLPRQENRQNILVIYYYSNIYDCFYYLLYDNIKCRPFIYECNTYKKTKIDGLMLAELFALYKNAFLRNKKERELFGVDNKKKLLVYSYLVNLFLIPLNNLFNTQSNLITKMNIGINDIKMHFDLATIFNLRFCVSDLAYKNDFSITQTTELSISDFLKRISNTSYPQISAVSVLNCFEYEKSSLKSIFTNCKNVLIEKGGYWNDIANIEELLLQFTITENSQPRNILLLISHFHSGYLFIKKDPYNFIDFLNKLQDLEKRNQLRRNIVLDSICCKNWSEFKKLYKLPFSQIISSHLNLDTKYTLNILYELISSFYLYKYNFGIEYLDGETLMNEAWIKAQKTLFITMKKENNVKIPF